MEVSKLSCTFAIDMDVAFLFDKYFKGTKNVSIDVFDAQTLNAVYKDVINAMTSHFEMWKRANWNHYGRI